MFLKFRNPALIINPLVPEIFFGEFLDENLGASSYKCQNKVRKAGK